MRHQFDMQRAITRWEGEGGLVPDLEAATRHVSGPWDRERRSPVRERIGEEEGERRFGFETMETDQ